MVVAFFRSKKFKGPWYLNGKKLGVVKRTLLKFFSIKYLQVNDIPENSVEFFSFGKWEGINKNI
ncbi:MAG: hypothetical protein DRP87_02170 [Spirochaetes bacterium]|nr:MAG: hypothetical protein DRP87_02170 [Spirochaetota bacterium]